MVTLKVLIGAVPTCMILAGLCILLVGPAPTRRSQDASRQLSIRRWAPRDTWHTWWGPQGRCCCPRRVPATPPLHPAPSPSWYPREHCGRLRLHPFLFSHCSLLPFPVPIWLSHCDSTAPWRQLGVEAWDRGDHARPHLSLPTGGPATALPEGGALWKLEEQELNERLLICRSHSAPALQFLPLSPRGSGATAAGGAGWAFIAGCLGAKPGRVSESLLAEPGSDRSCRAFSLQLQDLFLPLGHFISGSPADLTVRRRAVSDPEPQTAIVPGKMPLSAGCGSKGAPGLQLHDRLGCTPRSSWLMWVPERLTDTAVST